MIRSLREVRPVIPWRATLVLIAGGCMMVLGLPQPLPSHGSPGERTVASAIPPGPTYWVSARQDNPHIMLGAVAVRRDRDLLTFGGAGGWCFTGVRSANGWFSGASATTEGLRFFQIRFRIHRDVLVQKMRSRPGAKVFDLPFYRATRGRATKVARLRGDTLRGMLDDCPTRDQVSPRSQNWPMDVV